MVPAARSFQNSLHLETHLEGKAFFVQHGKKGHLLEVVGLVALLLPAVVSQVLAKKSALIAKADPDQGNVQVAGGFEMVSGQHAEPSRIHGQALGNAVFGAEIGDHRSALKSVEAGHGAALGEVFFETRRNG